MQLLASRPALLEARLQQVDQALGLAQLGGRHPLEILVTEHLALCCTRRARRRRLRGRILIGASSLSMRIGTPRWSASWDCCRPPASGCASPSPHSVGPRPARGGSGEKPPGERQRRVAPQPVEHQRHNVEVVAAAGEDRLRRRRGPVRGRRCRRASGPARSRWPRRGRPPARRRAARVRNRPPRPAGVVRRRRARVWPWPPPARVGASSPRSRPRPRRGSGVRARRGPGGCPPRT